MYVLFDGNGREYLRYFVEPNEELKKLAVVVDENNIPVKENCTTVIYKNVDGSVKYEFEQIQPSERDVMLMAINDLQLKVLKLEKGVK